ncbi:hypothetical protein CEXT_93981 [Caerostris extrusa]|uniref:Secreted protein n=1 Tax=Caerostris extrusa TaxID=172846 RepID=A0AAV4U7A1_CAEEX|nr:hypothetical protein CEXT_93981 [Caerostris extrusa]
MKKQLPEASGTTAFLLLSRVLSGAQPRHLGRLHFDLLIVSRFALWIRKQEKKNLIDAGHGFSIRPRVTSKGKRQSRSCAAFKVNGAGFFGPITGNENFHLKQNCKSRGRKENGAGRK